MGASDGDYNVVDKRRHARFVAAKGQRAAL